MPSAAVITASAADASATEASSSGISSSSSSAVVVVPHSTVAAVPVLLDADGDAVAEPASRRRRKRSQWNVQPSPLMEAGTSLFCGNDNNSSSSGVTQAPDTSLRDQCDKAGQVADLRVDIPAPMISDAAAAAVTLFSPRRPCRSRSRVVEEVPQELSMPSAASSSSSSSGSAALQRSNSGSSGSCNHNNNHSTANSSSAAPESNAFKITSSMSAAERAAAERRKSVHLAEILQGLGMSNLSAVLLDEAAAATASAPQDNTAAVLAQARQAERGQSQAALAPSLLPISHSRAASPALVPLTLPLQAELSPPSLATLERAQQHQQQGVRSAHPSPMLQATSLRA
jgi:hypothetical protein